MVDIIFYFKPIQTSKLYVKDLSIIFYIHIQYTIAVPKRWTAKGFEVLFMSGFRSAKFISHQNLSNDEICYSVLNENSMN